MRCNAIFVKESDVYMHSNNCSGVIGPNTCNKCERNVKSRAALNKHKSICKGKEQLALCRNGDTCRFYKANNFNFFHSKRRQYHQQNRKNQPPSQKRQNQQPRRMLKQQPVKDQNNHQWTTVQSRSRKPLWTCNHCDKNIYNQDASRSHVGTCMGMNRQSVNVSPHNRQSGQKQFWCQFQERCTKGQSCGFKHFQAFPMGDQRLQHH